VISVHDWETIRLRCGRNKEPIKLVSRETGIAPNTIRKYLRQSEPPIRRPRSRARLLDPYVSHVDELIKSTPKITAARVGSYLREHVDAALRIDERTLRSFVASRRTLLVPKEAFVRASYAPGDQAQFDFSPMSVVLAGELVIVQLFVMRLSYSGRTFARVSMRCDRPSLFTGLLEACRHFCGTPRSSLFDNASTAVSRVLRGAARTENTLFAEFRGALMLDVRFAAPGKGNEKGGVEGVHGYIEDNFFRPTPAFDDLASLNAALLAFCDRDMLRTQAGQTETIGRRFANEAPLLGALPAVLPRTCVVEPVRINKFAECTYETNRYSVPTRYAIAMRFSKYTRRKFVLSLVRRLSPSIDEISAKMVTSWTFGITSTSSRESIVQLKRRSFSPTRGFQRRSVRCSIGTALQRPRLRRNVGPKCSHYSPRLRSKNSRRS